jgi:hypothetical protein
MEIICNANKLREGRIGTNENEFSLYGTDKNAWYPRT